MTAQQPQTKAGLIDSLRTSGTIMVERLRALPPERFEEGRYENGWNGRQILAHVASIEWTYPRLLDIAKDAKPADAKPAAASAGDAPAPTIRQTDPNEAGDTATRPVRGGILNYNDRQVEKRAEKSVAELLDEFEKNRAKTIAAVEAADDALFAREIRSAGGITGALADVINGIAVIHVLGHASDILGEPVVPQA